jgi:hypothetical protein
MKQVIFKKLFIKNFLSIGDDPVEINIHHGLNFITGSNLDKEDSSNGVGKSSIIESLFFVLFGNTLRELKKEQIINNVNKKGCKVIVSFDVIEGNKKDEYVLMRGIVPTKISLLKNGENITESSIPKTTAMVCKIISSTPEVFENSVIMTVNNTIPFMAQKKVEKRKFIEGILRLSVFSEMLLLVRQDHNEAKKTFDIEQTKLKEIKKSYDIYCKHRDEQEELKQDRINVLKERSKNNHNELKKLKIKKISNTALIECKKNIKLLQQKENQCKIKIKKIIQDIASWKSTINNNVNNINELLKLENEKKCYTCFRPFESKLDKEPVEKKKNYYKTRNKKLTNSIITTETKLKELEDIQNKCVIGINKYTEKIHDINNIIQENKNIKDRINQLNNWNKQIIIDIEKLKSENNNFSTLIEESEIRLKVLKENIDKLNNRINILDAVKFIVSEEGVKSFIVKKILKILNGKLLYYLKKLDANCICTFNEYFEENIITDKGQECSYHNFSSGERRRIDLAMLFTFMDIRRLQGDVIVNISFYDEILDSSLDDKGIGLFLDILQQRTDKHQECVYIVSHKESTIKKATGDVIYLEKKNGFTKVVNNL